MSSKSTKSILKEPTIDLYEEVETGRCVPTRSEQLFDQLISTANTYGHRKKPLMSVKAPIGYSKQITTNDSVVSDGDSTDADFEPSAKTSRTKKKATDKRQNRVKFVDLTNKKPNKKNKMPKKSKDYPDCTKESLLLAFQMAGLPDYDEIAKMELHVTKVKDIVKPDPPTPPLHVIMAPFEDLIDWNASDQSSDLNIESSQQSPQQETSGWETEDTDTEDSNDINNSTVIDKTVSKSVSNSKSISKNKTIDFRSDVLQTAGIGANRIASTPTQQKCRHEVTIKNLSPIEAMSSPTNDFSFVAPLPPSNKSRKAPKISVPKKDIRLDIVEPSISDLKTVNKGYKRSKELSRTLINASKPTLMSEDLDSDQTIVDRTVLKTKMSVNSKGVDSFAPKLPNNTLETTDPQELSTDFDPILKSTPLIRSKQKKTNNTSFELIVDRSHFDMSLSKFCRTDITPKMSSFPKTTTIIPIPVTQCSKSLTKTQKKCYSDSYHTYRQSIAAVHSLYNNSCQPFRTVIKTIDGNPSSDNINDQSIRSVCNDENDLKAVFNQSLSTSMFSSSKVVSKGVQTVLLAKRKVLLYCEPNKVIDFEKAFDKNMLKQCRKIGEGSYGEVFATKDSDGKDIVIKIVALIQNENQKQEDIFSQFLPELVVSLNFNRLKTGVESNSAPNFIDMIKASVTRGVFPSKLLEEWDKFNNIKNSENEDPRSFPKGQHFIVFYLANGGTDLESCQLNSAIESLSIFIQLSLALAAAEQAFQFEHRDLHWGNVLVSHTNETQLKYRINGKVYEMSTNGVLASIIDFSLSRMTDKEFIIFDDLAKYSDLFEGTGDYQFEIYRMMKELNGNDWKQFVPKTNIFWLHYILDKTISFKKYSLYRTKRHKNCIEILNSIYNSILNYNSCTELIQSSAFGSYLSQL